MKVKEYIEEISESFASNEEKYLKQAFSNIATIPEGKETQANEIKGQDYQNANIKNKLKRTKVSIAISIAILCITFGVGDYYGWWDYLRGRSDVIVSYNKLSNTKAYPEILIYDSEEEFNNLYSFIIKRTQVPTLKELHKTNNKPEFLIRVGRNLGQESNDRLTPSPPLSNIAPETLPLFFVYSFSGEEYKAVRVCLLNDLTRWVEESRNQERIIFFMAIVSVLAITIAVVDILV